MLDLYNLDTSMSTPSKELGFIQHEMFEVLTLSIVATSCKDYFPRSNELHLLKAKKEQTFNTY